MAFHRNALQTAAFRTAFTQFVNACSKLHFEKLHFQQYSMKQILTIAIALLLGASIAIRAKQPLQRARPAQPHHRPAGTSEVERVVVSGGEIESSETDKAQSVTILSEDNLKLHTSRRLGTRSLSNRASVPAISRLEQAAR